MRKIKKKRFGIGKFELSRVHMHITYFEQHRVFPSNASQCFKFQNRGSSLKYSSSIHFAVNFRNYNHDTRFPCFYRYLHAVRDILYNPTFAAETVTALLTLRQETTFAIMRSQNQNKSLENDRE